MMMMMMVIGETIGEEINQDCLQDGEAATGENEAAGNVWINTDGSY
jgi:hypothetical protein